MSLEWQKRERKSHRYIEPQLAKKHKKTMGEILQAMKQYNEEHNTHISYGKFVAMMEGANARTK